MVDVQRLAEGLEFGEPLPEFNALRAQIEGHFSEGKLERARLDLEAQRDLGDDKRSAEENGWLYSQLGRVYLAGDKIDQAIDAYTRAFELEPREIEVAQTLSELLMARECFDEGLGVAQMILLNHKQDLDDEEVASIHRRIGLLHEGRGAFDKARTSFEKALVKEPENPEALTGLLRAVGEVGEPGDVVDARLKLIRSLDDARARSMALVALGNDWVEKFNDPARALDTYEDAVMEWAKNTHAVERIAEVAAELGDWRRVGRAYFTLSVLAKEPQKKAEFLIRSSDVARKELWEPEKALAGYRKALEYDATRLDAFRSITSILVDARDWDGLEEEYRRIIAANQHNQAEPGLLAILWEKLADLYQNHLERIDDAITAYSQALQFDPQRRDLRVRLVGLTEEKEDHLAIAEGHLRFLMNSEPEQPDWLDRLGRVYLRQKKVDAAFCLFRALRARGGTVDQKAAGFLQRFDSNVVRPIKGQINPSMMHRYVFAEGMDQALNECFSILKNGFEEWVGETRKKYGLGRKDRVKLSDPLAFVNFYKSIGAALGYVDLPELWRKSDTVGLVNGALVPAGLIVGDEKLGSGQEKHIAFVVAKQLFLFLPSFYLVAIRPLSDLQAFFMRAVALVRPEINPELVDSLARDPAFKDLRRKLKSDEQEALRRTITDLKVDQRQIALGPWVEAIEDTANRMGFLFCDDLRVVEACLREEERSISQRSIEERMKALVDYSVSEKYLSLRSQLGIEVA